MNIIVKLALQSMRDHPDDWYFDRFYATNPALKLSIKFPQRIDEMEVEGFGYVIKGNLLMGYLVPWRHKVFRLIREVQKLQLMKRYKQVYGS